MWACENGGMNKKEQFLKSIEILAPGDALLFKIANLVAEASLPAFPGAAALELVAAVERLKPLLADWLSYRTKRPTSKCNHQSCRAVANRKELRKGLPLSDAMRVESAEYWLGLGQPVEAIMELDRVSEASKKHPWFVKAKVSAVGALREMNEHALAC